MPNTLLNHGEATSSTEQPSMLVITTLRMWIRTSLIVDPLSF